MAKVKLTKGELKKQRDALKQFKRYLPTLQLKKQQLQMKILEAKKELAHKEKIYGDALIDIQKWKGLLADPGVDLTPWITPLDIETEIINVAGARVPLFVGLNFKNVNYDFYEMPFWVDSGVEELRKLMQSLVEVAVVKERIRLLEHELRVRTTQRVNLFEKVKIPECNDNIRVIRIYLGDQQANAVGIGKVAKKKVEERNEEELLV